MRKLLVVAMRWNIGGIVNAVVQTSRNQVTSLSDPDYCVGCGEYLDECECEEDDGD